MDVPLQSAEFSEDMDCESSPKQEVLSSTDTDNKNLLSTVTAQGDKDIIEQEKSIDVSEDDIQYSKNLNVREIHETSPFKQAVRGFVLSKLTKKVGTSHILSGITEKLVKKLEDNKDIAQSVSVHNSESDLSISSLKIKETSTEVISSSVSCELKSVVANDLALSEILNIEDAIECVEEPKSRVNDIDVGINIPLRNEFRSNSISLPSSPAHQFSKRASSVSYSLESVESTRKDSHTPDLSFLCEESKSNGEFQSEKLKLLDEIELKDKGTCTNNEKCINSKVTYMCNVYSSEKEDIPAFKTLALRKISSFLSNFKNVLTSLSLSHFFLLASVLIHNLGIISSYIAFIFDGLVIAYVFYSYICVLAQKPIPNKSQSFPFVDPHLENASLQIHKNNKFVKGSVKVLKGEYDPEMVKNHPTDLVDISIENCCLKIYTPKKKNNKDILVKSESFTVYDLQGATITIVPKGLSKKRIWNKKYPICIELSLTSKKLVTPHSGNDVDSPSADYLSATHCEDNVTNLKALYFFVLTDREKESLFWALRRNTENSDNLKCNEPFCDTSSKTDFSTMSYTSLLELNIEDSLSPCKDTFDEETSDIADKTNGALNFENYMNNLFGNFERMNKFTPRSRSFEDLSNLTEDISKPSDSFMSKDDSFLSSNSKEYSVDWLNLALGRTFYDFLTQKYWSNDIKARIQKKLDKIEMPTFIESLEVSDVFLGTSLPQIHTVSKPVADINGVWFDFDFNYCGSFQMTLKTKLKMTKAKQFSNALEATDMKQNVIAASSESDDDEGNEPKVTSAKKKKLINRIEKWISHKHFQTVAQSRFVKKYVGDLSNMPLTLTVELNTLHGTLTLNIPPAPTDRIWYGFRKDPVLSLNAYPKVGTHEINLSAVVQMIEKKLIQEFKKALVMPNMDDLLIPVMYTPIYEL